MNWHARLESRATKVRDYRGERDVFDTEDFPDSVAPFIVKVTQIEDDAMRMPSGQCGLRYHSHVHRIVVPAIMAIDACPFEDCKAHSMSNSSIDGEDSIRQLAEITELVFIMFQD